MGAPCQDLSASKVGRQGLEGPQSRLFWVGMEVLEALLDKNPNVSAQDVDGWTPLHRAALSKHALAVKILLRAGADPFAKNKQGDTPLETICRYEHSSVKCITQ